MRMRNEVKSCDLPKEIAALIFQELNDGVTLVKRADGVYIMTDKNLADLKYPEGWYFAEGTFRNKHNTTGAYSEVSVIDSFGNYRE